VETAHPFRGFSVTEKREKPRPDDDPPINVDSAYTVAPLLSPLLGVVIHVETGARKVERADLGLPAGKDVRTVHITWNGYTVGLQQYARSTLV
jgi:hypothetical protein